MFLWVSELCASKAIQTGVGTEHSSNLQHKPRKKSWCPHPEPSSWTLCGSYLSSVSSGNHSRSDPVQVQSTLTPAADRCYIAVHATQACVCSVHANHPHECCASSRSLCVKSNVLASGPYPHFSYRTSASYANQLDSGQEHSIIGAIAIYAFVAV